jgi:hypothetical protein
VQRGLEGPAGAAFRLSAVLIAALLAVSGLPYLYAWYSSPNDLVFTGLMFDVPDHAQYWSWVVASRESLFISNTMTPEPNPPIFTNPIMWLLARVQMAFDLSFPALFQWWRIGAIILLVPVLVAFVRVMVPERERRGLALALSLFGAGFGWLWVVVKQLTRAADVAYPTDLYTLEPNTFWALLSYPHLLLAHALILATVLGAWLAHQRKGWWTYALAAAAATALSVSHAYDLITVYTVLGLFGLAEWWRERTFPTRLAIAGVTIGACSAPLALYYQQLTSRDPLWQAILAQYSNAGVWTPPHLHLIVLMGLPLLLAVIGLLPRDGWSGERRLLAIWTCAGLVLIYLPVVYQIKLLSGWQFPIAILAAHAWYERVVPALRQPALRTALTAALVAFVSLTNVYLYAWRLVDLRRHSAPYYVHRDELAALEWLAANTSASDVVLAPANVGQFVPNYGKTRAYLAHWAMTNRYFERRANVERFFSSSPEVGWRRDLMRREGVTLVLKNNWSDVSASTYDFSQSPELELVFARPRAEVYRLRDDARAQR